jgi:hypothetical protein
VEAEKGVRGHVFILVIDRQAADPLFDTQNIVLTLYLLFAFPWREALRHFRARRQDFSSQARRRFGEAPTG